MRAYIIRRLLLIIPTVIIASAIVFLSIRLVPGDIVTQMALQRARVGGFLAGGEDEGAPGEEQTGGVASVTAREEAVAHIERQLGLDVPIYVQYGRWWGVVPQADGNFSGIIQGDLGRSLWKDTKVTDEIAARIPVTAVMLIMAILVAV
ncbi:hypothetical protein ACFLU0_01915, partial [Chloroflexota bacterium]